MLLNNFFQKIDEYRRTRLKLTLLYFIIIFVIVTIFSFIASLNEFNQLERFNKLRNNFITLNYVRSPVPIPDDYIIKERMDVQNTVDDVRLNIIISILLADSIITVLALLLSYYLSGETLKPLVENLEQQKRFVADASHELKTPLTSMKVEAEVLLRSKNFTVDEYKEFAVSVREEVNRLTELTTDLLDIARSDSNSQAQVKEEFDLNLLMLNLTERLKKRCLQNKIALYYEYSIPDSSFLLIISNKNRLERLLNIILDNAIKYNIENGKINIKLSKVNQIFNLEIKDSGIGMNKEHLEKIFDRFFRISEDRHQKGFGLGLSIAKQICKELNIQIKFESEINKGTTVMLKIHKLLN